MTAVLNSLSIRSQSSSTLSSISGELSLNFLIYVTVIFHGALCVDPLLLHLKLQISFLRFCLLCFQQFNKLEIRDLSFVFSWRCPLHRFLVSLSWAAFSRFWESTLCTLFCLCQGCHQCSCHHYLCLLGCWCLTTHTVTAIIGIILGSTGIVGTYAVSRIA